MRVHFQISGGIGFFPGLAATRTIEVDALDEETRRQVVDLIQEAHFFTLPAHTPAPSGAADYQTYRITIEDGSRRHSVDVSDPVLTASLRHLIETLRTLAND